MSTIDIAQKFANLGYFVFPLYKGRGGDKLKPWGWALNKVNPGKADKAIPATDDVSVVERWPEMVKSKYRSEVVGFGILGNRCVILDLDIKGDKEGISEFKALANKYDVPQPTMMTATKSGGLHLFYKKSKDVRLKTTNGIQIGTDRYLSIDLRGDGGFVVGPESFVDDLHEVDVGHYGMKDLMAIDQLPEIPEKIMLGWTRTMIEEDLDNIVSLPSPDDLDFKSLIRRGIIPDNVPKGSRNNSFFYFINHWRDQGVPIDVTRKLCLELATKVEEPDTLVDSVDIDVMLAKAYIDIPKGPVAVAMDLIKRGLFQLTGYKNRIHYVILEDNPYIASRGTHDENSMKVLLKRYERSVLNEKTGKNAIVNPISVVAKRIGNENRVDLVGFKPGAGETFTMSDEPGSKRFLNTYRPLTIDYSTDELDDGVWDEFILLLTRLFGEKDSPDYQLGLDFIAWLVQKPQIKPSMSPFIMSTRRGVGKSLLFNVIISIMGTAKDGERQARLVKLDELSGRFFNPSGATINLIDEVQFPVHKNTRQESTSFWRHLKNLITAETISVEIKGGITYQAPNTAAIALAGNSGGGFPIEEFDRRLWVIDANAPLLELGTVDRLFDLVRRSDKDFDDRNRYVSTLRYRLLHHRIKNDLSSIRAPDTSVKTEMWENSLTDIEAWFVDHFSNPGNLFAATPIVSASAMDYVFEMTGRNNDRDASTHFRNLKRKARIRPIKLLSGPSRQFSISQVGLDGSMIRTDKRDILYTTRNHGEFDSVDTDRILALFRTNCATINRWRQQMITQKRTKVSGEELLRGYHDELRQIS